MGARAKIEDCGAQIALAIRTGEAVPRAAALGRVEFVGWNLRDTGIQG
jgi:hypothetical protein